MYFTSSPDSALSTTRRSLMYPSKVGKCILSRFNPMSKTVWLFSIRSKGPLETLLLSFPIPSMYRIPSFLSRLHVNATCIHLLGMVFLWLWENRTQKGMRLCANLRFSIYLLGRWIALGYTLKCSTCLFLFINITWEKKRCILCTYQIQG